MKKILFLLIVGISIFCFSTNVYAAPKTYTRTSSDLRLPSDVDLSNVNISDVYKTPSVDADAKVYDFADILTDAEESQIYILLCEYIKNTGIDAAIVTTKDLAGFGLNDYTYNFYDFNDFKSVGITFVIYVGSDRTSIFMGNSGPGDSEVYAAYTDSVVSNILKHIYDNHIVNKDYVGACETYIKLVDGYYIKTFGEHRVGEEISDERSVPWLAASIISVVLTFIAVALIFTNFQKPKKLLDLTMKKSINEKSMIVKCEADNPISGKTNLNT